MTIKEHIAAIEAVKPSIEAILKELEAAGIVHDGKCPHCSGEQHNLSAVVNCTEDVLMSLLMDAAESDNATFDRERAEAAERARVAKLTPKQLRQEMLQKRRAMKYSARERAAEELMFERRLANESRRMRKKLGRPLTDQELDLAAKRAGCNSSFHLMTVWHMRKWNRASTGVSSAFWSILKEDVIGMPWAPPANIPSGGTLLVEEVDATEGK